VIKWLSTVSDSCYRANSALISDSIMLHDLETHNEKVTRVQQNREWLIRRKSEGACQNTSRHLLFGASCRDVEGRRNCGLIKVFGKGQCVNERRCSHGSENVGGRSAVIASGLVLKTFVTSRELKNPKRKCEKIGIVESRNQSMSNGECQCTSL
jgi:hypothetical protein